MGRFEIFILVQEKIENFSQYLYSKHMKHMRGFQTDQGRADKVIQEDLLDTFKMITADLYGVISKIQKNGNDEPQCLEDYYEVTI